MTLGELLERVREVIETREDLVARGTICTEAEQIVEAVLSMNRTELHFGKDRAVSQERSERALSFARRRSEGELLQHILGYATFLGHRYRVSPDVLVPRPETEVLVECLFKILKHPGRGMEIGVGSGIISVELLSRFPDLTILATEVSAPAAAFARENAQAILGQENHRLQLELVAEGGRIWPARPGVGPVDFVVSNPPYLKRDEAEMEVVRCEPAQALFAPEGDPLFFYRALSTPPEGLLSKEGLVAVEIPHERSSDIQKTFEEAGWSSSLRQDLTGRDRLIIAQRR